MTDGAWASLFSGGKDSSWALYRALEQGFDVARLVTVHPPADAYMYHVPATDLAGLAAESIGIQLVDVETTFDVGRASGPQGDREIEPLEGALRNLDGRVPLAGIIAGAVESEYQSDRLRGLCDRLEIELFAPLWRQDPRELFRSMLAAEFEIIVVRVAAGGLDESWLGRTLDGTAFSDLERLNEEHGVHVLGEGGEFETLVTDGPHMTHPIRFDADTVWEGTHGELRITDAWLGD